MSDEYPVKVLNDKNSDIIFFNNSHEIAKQDTYPAVWRNEPDFSIGLVFAKTLKTGLWGDQVFFKASVFHDEPMGYIKSGL
jgi:hypothetical protein